MSISFITGSEHKFIEVSGIVGGLERLDIDLPEIQGIDPKAIIEAKLHEAAKRHPGELIVEDTSLFLDCLPGLPGPLIKWFKQAIGIKGIWELADRFDNYGAEGRATIGYSDGQGHIRFFEGRIRGTIVEPRGASDFGWDPIFQPEGESRTFAEMTKEEKRRISHRGRAAQALKEFLVK